MLVGFCFWEDFPSQYPESFEALKETHLPLFVHTVNDKAVMQQFIEEGIDGIYTDVVNKEDQYTEGD
jgi:glycerophosphoryl diester phosphodiesterase